MDRSAVTALPLGRVLAFVAIGMLGALWVARLVRWLWSPKRRLFSYSQERVVADAVGPACVWRRTTALPQAGSLLAIARALSNPSPTLWITGLVLGLVAIPGLPLTVTRKRCGGCHGPIVRAHKHAAADDGTVNIFNLELACEYHNARQSDRRSWWWALSQVPFVWAFPVYAFRSTSQTLRVAWLLLTDERSRERARA